MAGLRVHLKERPHEYKLTLCLSPGVYKGLQTEHPKELEGCNPPTTVVPQLNSSEQGPQDQGREELNRRVEEAQNARSPRDAKGICRTLLLG